MHFFSCSAASKQLWILYISCDPLWYHDNIIPPYDTEIACNSMYIIAAHTHIHRYIHTVPWSSGSPGCKGFAVVHSFSTLFSRYCRGQWWRLPWGCRLQRCADLSFASSMKYIVSQCVTHWNVLADLWHPLTFGVPQLQFATRRIHIYLLSCSHLRDLCNPPKS